MKLFNNEKDLIHRILNLILIVWFVGALFAVAVTLINMFVKAPILTYSEYKADSCSSDYYYYKGGVGLDETEIDYEKNCLQSYAYYESNLKDEEYNNSKGLYISLGNVVIVGASLLFLNPITLKKKQVEVAKKTITKKTNKSKAKPKKIKK